MARQFNELIKEFNTIRAYARDFYVNGFKKREDFQEKSLRSYDDQRRRIESYLNDFVYWEQEPSGKSLRLELKQEQSVTNPFFRLWQTKSFTKNDIFLHFILLDCLSQGPHSLPQLAALIHDRYLANFEEEVALTDLTIRNKLKEYCHLGLLEEREDDKRIVYQLRAPLSFPEELTNVLHFFKETTPGGVIGQFLLDQQAPTTSPFVFKHQFITHSLDEQIVINALEAIAHKRLVTIRQFNDKESTLVPMSVYVSTETGRQYLVGQAMRPNSLTSVRIDTIKTLAGGSPVKDYDTYQASFQQKKKQNWNGSFNQQRLKHLKVLLRIDEKSEEYLFTRLQREQRMGHCQRLDHETVAFEIELTDLFALNPFLRTFVGRILSIESSDSHWRERFIRDLDQLINLYSLD